MDRYLFFLINAGYHCPALDLWMGILSSWALWMPIVIAATIVVLLRGGFKARSFVCCAVLVLAFTDGVLVNGLKHLVHRPRPFQSMQGVRMVSLHHRLPEVLAVTQPAVVKYSKPPTSTIGNAFPSAHVANNFAVAVLLAWFCRRRGWLYFVVAGAVAYSRIYVGDHYPLDVLAGAIAGILSAIGSMLVLELAWKRLASKHLSTLSVQQPTLTGNP